MNAPLSNRRKRNGGEAGADVAEQRIDTVAEELGADGDAESNEDDEHRIFRRRRAALVPAKAIEQAEHGKDLQESGGERRQSCPVREHFLPVVESIDGRRSRFKKIFGKSYRVARSPRRKSAAQDQAQNRKDDQRPDWHLSQRRDHREADAEQREHDR